jgi:4-alpha-glucanotransferase
MLDKRGAGVLFHISSVPSDYGIGVFDRNCLDFIDKLSYMKFGYWQVLPFNPVDDANSPYCSSSAFAGNYLFIDPQRMVEYGLNTQEEADDNIYHGTPFTADYEFAKLKRMELLKKAFERIDAVTAQKVKDFSEENPWVIDFSLFMALKEANGQKSWWEWDDEYSHYDVFMEKHRYDFEEKSAFWRFVQYIFFRQWKEIKDYANLNGIAIIGDMPIYVAMDSVDVWSNLELFKINKETLKPDKVAGVPPDYFSEDGQLWGNPLYDWDVMEKDGYKWWISRLGHSLETYDVVRIDHFRAFASYWEIPADSETAKTGEWAVGPRMKFFNKVFEKYPDAPIIAEDLGIFGEDVVKLLEDTGFPGMKVVQFAFEPGADSSHLPHNTVQNSVNYVGTHDNNTILGWLWEADEESRRFALDYIGFEDENWGDGGYYSKSCRKVIESVWKSSSNTAVVAFQDMCGFGSDARMNIPSVPEKNWRYRTDADTINRLDADYFKKINVLCRRNYPVFEKD